MGKRDFKLNISKEMQGIKQKTVEMNREKKLIWLNPNILLDDEDNEFFYGDYQNDVDMLSRSIKRDGFNEVIFAYKVGEQYKIRAGHRRKYAAIKAGVDLVPVVLESAPKTDFERVIGLLDANNNKREDKPMILAKTAARYFELIQARRNEDEEYAKEVKGIATKDLVADKMGKSSGQVSKYASLMKLIPALQEKADDENYSWSALCSASVLSEEKQALVNDIIDYAVSEYGYGIVKREWLNEIISEVKTELYTTLEEYNCLTVRQQKEDFARKTISMAFTSGTNENPPTETVEEESSEKKEDSKKKKQTRKKAEPTVAQNIRSSAYMLTSLLENTNELSASDISYLQASLYSVRNAINKFLGE